MGFSLRKTIKIEFDVSSKCPSTNFPTKDLETLNSVFIVFGTEPIALPHITARHIYDI